MSSGKRGRKRNDNLPPNRARDVQRAFRARRAAHLEALEQRVSELEEENNTLRLALNLPPANRPPLGKGPTGKDKPKPLPSASASHLHDLLTRPPDANSHGGSADSPNSTRTHSLSPSTVTAATGAMRPSPHPAQTINGGGWEQQIIVADQQQQQDASASSSTASYPMPSHKPTNQSHYTYSSPIPSSSRPSISSGIYLPPVSQTPHNYTHTNDRPMADSFTAAAAYPPLRGIRDDSQHFYSQQNFHHQTDASQVPSMSHHSPLIPVSQTHDHRESAIQASMPYPHRRSITEPQYGRPLISHYQQLPPPHTSSHPQASNSMRRLSPPRILDSHTLRSPYGTAD